MAAPSWVKNQSTVGGGAGNDTTVTATLPGSLTVGNMLVMAVQVFRSSVVPTLTTPTGWTKIIDGSTSYGFNFCRLFVFAKQVVGGDSNPSMTSNPVAWIAEISEFTGADTSPSTITAAAGSTSSGTSIATPAITTPSVDNLLVWVESQNTNFNDISAGPSGSTLRVNHFDASWGLNIAFADKTQATAATVAAASFTRSHTDAPAIAHSLALQPPAPGPPTADFTGTPLSGTAPLSVAFTDTSTGTPTSWAWTFGDGGTSTSQNPTHSYTTSGVYTVVLVATNAGGSNTKTRTGYVNVAETIAYVTGGGITIY